jgi:hypothetical protein
MGFVSSSLLRQHLLTCWFLVYLCAGTSGQTSVGVTPSTGPALPTVSPQVTPKTQDINTTVLQLETALSEEAKEHREFLRDSLDEMKWFVAIMAGLAIAILTLLNLKSAKDIRTQVNARFKADVDALVTDKVAQFETFVEQNKKKIEETSTQLNELSASFGDLVEGLTLSFAALDKHRIGAEWDASRRDAIRKLEALRNKFPVMRTVGILVGRLHASFDDHEVAIRVPVRKPGRLVLLIFWDAQRSDDRAGIYRGWRQYVNLAIGALLPSFEARRKWHGNNIWLAPQRLCVETVGLVCARR